MIHVGRESEGAHGNGGMNTIAHAGVSPSGTPAAKLFSDAERYLDADDTAGRGARGEMKCWSSAILTGGKSHSSLEVLRGERRKEVEKAPFRAGSKEKNGFPGRFLAFCPQVPR